MLKNLLYKPSVLLAVVVLASLLYLPFGWLTREYGNAFLNWTDNSYYWFVPGIWPTWTFLFFFLPFLAAFILRVRWYLALPMLVPLFVLWSELWQVYEWLGLPEGDTLGLYGYRNNGPELNTSKLSFYAQPVFVPMGVIGGVLIGLYLRSFQNTTRAKLPGLWRVPIAVTSGLLYMGLAVFVLGEPLSNVIARFGLNNVWIAGILSLLMWFLPAVSLPILVYVWLTRRYGTSGDSAFAIEVYSPRRKAEFVLSNAVDEQDYARAVEEVRKMGLDPAKIPHYNPHNKQ